MFVEQQTSERLTGGVLPMSFYKDVSNVEILKICCYNDYNTQTSITGGCEVKVAAIYQEIVSEFCSSYFLDSIKRGLTNMNYAPRPQNCIYLDRFDTPRLKSTNDQLLAIATLKFHALFPVNVPILSQTQVFDGLLPLLSRTTGTESEVEFQALIELIDQGNIAMSLFGTSDRLSTALKRAVTQGTDTDAPAKEDFFEFSGIPFLQEGTPPEMAERRIEFNDNLSSGRGRIGDSIADSVIDRVIELDERLIRNSHDKSQYVNVWPANTNLSRHIELYLKQNYTNDARLPKQLEAIFSEATDKQRGDRSYYYNFNIDGLKPAIDAFYNAVLAESNTGKSTGPFTFATSCECVDQTVEYYLDRLIGDTVEDNGYDALIKADDIKAKKLPVLLNLKWSKILEWEKLLSEHKNSLTSINNPSTYIKMKHQLLLNALKDEYRKRLNLWEIGGKSFCALGTALAGATAPEPFNIVAIAASVGYGTIDILNSPLLDRGDIKKVKKIYKSIRPIVSSRD